MKSQRFYILKIFLIVLGYFFIFGLGFVTGIYYSQNIYLGCNDYQKNAEKEDFTISHLDFFSSLKKKSTVNSFQMPIYNNQDVTINTNQISKESTLINFTDDEGDPRGFTIQVFCFQSPELSSKAIYDLRAKGYHAYQSIINLNNNKNYYRIRVGHFKNKLDANEILEKICKFENKEAFLTRE